MEIRKLCIQELTDQQFAQIVTIEETCGLEPYSREMLLDCIENLDTYACMDHGIIAGFITILPALRGNSGGLYIVNLNVARAYRRRGIGQLLIRTACRNYAQSHQGRYVVLDVARDNTAAWHLYRKLGFFLTDIPSRNGDTDAVMAIPLDELLREPT